MYRLCFRRLPRLRYRVPMCNVLVSLLILLFATCNILLMYVYGVGHDLDRGVGRLFAGGRRKDDSTLAESSPDISTTKTPTISVWPTGEGVYHDRILTQLRSANVLAKAIVEQKKTLAKYSTWRTLFDLFLGRTKSAKKEEESRFKGLKTILVLNGFIIGRDKLGRRRFVDDQCPVNSCYLAGDPRELHGESPDAVIIRSFRKEFLEYAETNVRPPKQVWIAFQLESPRHSYLGKFVGALGINWTATYRPDSTLVTPYERFVPFDNITSLPKKPKRNYAEGKSKLVAWFVTNCKDQSGRLNYTQALSRHINVDIYGVCGNLECARVNASTCNQMLKRDYKFYLSFENSLCRHYISEKFFWNGLNNDIVPIVMGAHPDDYRAVAPPNSYIHVDDFASPKHLADYLLLLDKNDTLYNEYFRWKGTGEFIDTKFWCRLCAMLHQREADNYVHWYENVQAWWSDANTCVAPDEKRLWASWRDAVKLESPKTKPQISHA